MTKEEYCEMVWKKTQFRNGGCGTQIGLLTLMLVIFLLCSCSTKKSVEYIDRETVKYVSQMKHDTLINDVHDSIFLSVIQKGDTVFTTKYKEKTVYKDRIVMSADTVWKDSIQKVYIHDTTTKEKIPRWCYACLLICAGFIVVGIIRFIKLFKL